MRYWNSKDEVTNVNLRYLESMSRSWSGINVEQFMDRIRGVIGVERMLPEAVRKHFDLPNLFVGSAPYDWSHERLEEEHKKLCAALSDGLANVESDPSLKKDGSASLDDRPASRGEEVLEAVEAYSDYRGYNELTALRYSVAGTHLQAKMDRLDKWLQRKRPSPGGQSIEYEIVSVIGDIRRHADELHHQPASYDYQTKRDRSPN
ncbi:hypothetical protein [Citromicrobium bathyomarinum]|uniref:hypothetical protein n=1 Tax=Citromicrobium bathyomarinum TaxID=72174 RepID=UPI001E4AAAEA|nr:hypothetical protein [Citromicrobium bathyomarinum]MCD1624023.1 hypothetical protein [Citromicrobium bathyomarinum]